MKTARWADAAALALLLGAAASGLSAQEPAATPATSKMEKSNPPAPQPPKEVSFPAFEQKTLANGLRVVVIEHHEQPVVSLRLVTRAGQLYEPADKAGLAQMTALLLTEGTESRSAQQIAQAIDQVGGSLAAGVDSDAAYVSALVTSDQLGLGLDLLSDVALRPSFPAEELERQRRQALGGLQVQHESPGYLAGAALARALYGEHPYGRPVLGTPDSVEALRRDDLVAFHRSRYVPNASILAVVGDVKAADALARVERAFGGWQKGAEPAVPAAKPAAGSTRKIVVLDKPDAVQTEIRVGGVAIAYTDPDYFTAQVYDTVLGGNAAARLFDEVRRKKGLAYGAYSSISERLQPGPFTASTSTKTETTAEALGLMLEVIQGLEDKPVPAGELAARKTYITGAFPLEIEQPDGIASKVLEAMFYGLGKDFLESYRDKVDAVGPAELQSFAERRIHPERGAVVLVGNAAAFVPELEKKYGKVEVIPYREVDLLRADLRKPKQEPAAAAAAPSGQ